MHFTRHFNLRSTAARLAAASLMVLASAAHAQVYKCQGADGRVAYQSSPCVAAGAAARPRGRPGDPVPEPHHTASDCATLRTALQVRKEDRARIVADEEAAQRSRRELLADKRVALTAPLPSVTEAYRSRLAQVDHETRTLQQAADRAGCMPGSALPPPATTRPAMLDDPTLPSEVRECHRLKYAIDSEYATIEYAERARRQTDPMVPTREVSGAAASRSRIADLTRQGEVAGCRGRGVHVGPSAAQMTLDNAAYCAQLQDNFAWHRNRARRTIAADDRSGQSDAAAGANEARKAEAEMRKFGCVIPK